MIFMLGYAGFSQNSIFKYFQSTGIYSKLFGTFFSRIIVTSFIPMCIMLKFVRWPYSWSLLCIVWVIHSNVWILDYLVDMIPGVSKNYVTYRQTVSNIKMLIEKCCLCGRFSTPVKHIQLHVGLCNKDTQECMKHCSIFNLVITTGYPRHFAFAYYCRKKNSRTFLFLIQTFSSLTFQLALDFTP